MTLTIRPTVAADISALTSAPLPFRIRAWTGLEGDTVIGIGGIGYMPDGTIIAFAELTPEARRRKVALHKTALRFMDEVRASGISRLVATADPDFPAAERWLRRLGFRLIADPRIDRQVWIWECTTSPAKP